VDVDGLVDALKALEVEHERRRREQDAGTFDGEGGWLYEERAVARSKIFAAVVGALTDPDIPGAGPAQERAFVHAFQDVKLGFGDLPGGFSGRFALRAAAERHGASHLVWELDVQLHLFGQAQLKVSAQLHDSGSRVDFLGEGTTPMALETLRQNLETIAFAPEISRALDGLRVVVAPVQRSITGQEAFYSATLDASFDEWQSAPADPSRSFEWWVRYGAPLTANGLTARSESPAQHGWGAMVPGEGVIAVHEETTLHQRLWPKGERGDDFSVERLSIAQREWEGRLDRNPHLWTFHHELAHAVQQRYLWPLRVDTEAAKPLSMLKLTSFELAGAKTGEDVLGRYAAKWVARDAERQVPWRSPDPTEWFANVTAQYLSADPLTGGAARLRAHDPVLASFLEALYGPR
jgi:hypothetical protein